MITHKQDDTSAESTFKQVLQFEEREHSRVEEAARKYEVATLEKLRLIDLKRSEKGELLRGDKNKELKEFASKEMTAIISGAQKEAERDVAGLESHAAKRRKHAEDELVKKVLDPSFFLSA